MSLLFISDLHLSPSHPDVVDLFLNFLSGPALLAEKLFILGDLFEGWIGDDDLSPFNQMIISKLKVLSHSTECFFMAGNRDFLISQSFAKMSGCHLLEEPTIIDIYGTPTLLLHGDTLCTLDVGYQRFRSVIRQPFIKKIFLNLPLSMRDKIFNGFRSRSKVNVASKSMEIMDVTSSAVEQEFVHHGVFQIIHGHVHRPKLHKYKLANGECKRWVLGDWGHSAWYVEATPSKIQLVNFLDHK